MRQGLYDEITNDLRNLKTSKHEDQGITKNLLKMIPCLTYDVYSNKINMNLLNKA